MCISAAVICFAIQTTKSIQEYLGAELCGVAVRYESLPAVLWDDVDPVVLLVQHVHNLHEKIEKVK
jgi:hypothetical protein